MARQWPSSVRGETPKSAAITLSGTPPQAACKISCCRFDRIAGVGGYRLFIWRRASWQQYQLIEFHQQQRQSVVHKDEVAGGGSVGIREDVPVGGRQVRGPPNLELVVGRSRPAEGHA